MAAQSDADRTICLTGPEETALAEVGAYPDAALVYSPKYGQVGALPRNRGRSHCRWATADAPILGRNAAANGSAGDAWALPHEKPFRPMVPGAGAGLVPHNPADPGRGEWLYRLLREPVRLAPRYLVRDLPFAVRLLIEALIERGARGLPGRR